MLFELCVWCSLHLNDFKIHSDWKSRSLYAVNNIPRDEFKLENMRDKENCFECMQNLNKLFINFPGLCIIRLCKQVYTYMHMFVIFIRTPKKLNINEFSHIYHLVSRFVFFFQMLFSSREMFLMLLSVCFYMNILWKISPRISD